MKPKCYSDSVIHTLVSPLSSFSHSKDIFQEPTIYQVMNEVLVLHNCLSLEADWLDGRQACEPVTTVQFLEGHNRGLCKAPGSTGKRGCSLWAGQWQGDRSLAEGALGPLVKHCADGLASPFQHSRQRAARGHRWGPGVQTFPEAAHPWSLEGHEACP